MRSLVFLCSLFLAACGQTGPLTLPGDAPSCAAVKLAVNFISLSPSEPQNGLF